MITNSTLDETLKIGIACAIAAHCFALMYASAPKVPSEDVPTRITIKLENSEVSTAETGETLAMESLSEQTLTDKKLADQKRQIYLDYLEDISLCIHARRFLQPNSSNLIGIALYKIQVNAEGLFTSASLYKSSGDRALDAAGLTAVKACSGLVKRPPSTGLSPMNIYQEVRYQFKLR